VQGGPIWEVSTRAQSIEVSGNVWSKPLTPRVPDLASRNGKKLAMSTKNLSGLAAPTIPDERTRDRFPVQAALTTVIIEVLIVAQALVTEMLRKLLAVCDSLKIAVEVDPDPISKRDAIFLYQKRTFALPIPQIGFSLEDHERDATLGKGLPRFRALAR